MSVLYGHEGVMSPRVIEDNTSARHEADMPCDQSIGLRACLASGFQPPDHLQGVRPAQHV